MSEQDPPDSTDDRLLKDLIRRAVDVPRDEDPLAPTPSQPEGKSLLPAVQKKLRVRSKGKFYGDGWSTSQSKVSYAVIALVMLLVIAVCWFALGPTGVTGH
jgi:hypothetical protein